MSRTLDVPTRLPEIDPSRKPASAPAAMAEPYGDEAEESDDELEGEELERMEDIEAKLEAELQAAMEELSKQLSHTEFGKLDSKIQSRVTNLGPRYRTQQAQKQ